MTNRDMKNYRAPESAALSKTVTYLIIFSLLATFAWMLDRDSYEQDTHFIGYCGD